MTKYNQVKREQAKILEDLEKIFGRTFSLVEKIEWNTFGIKIEGDNVVGLGLYRCKLTTLPESVTQLKSLTHLYLHNNQISTLPESIGQLSSLKELDLENNKLTTLPESISNFKSLQKLDLENNQLTTLPESLGQLSSLKDLSLHYNQITTLPESLGQLKTLQKLYLNNNQLITLPESIGQLSSLQTLCLNDNQLTTLPESVTQLTSLQILYLGNTQLTTLPESLWRLKNLKTLNLTENRWEGEWAEVNKNDIPTMRKLCQKLHGIVVFISHAWDDQKQYRIVDLKKYLENDIIVQEQDIPMPLNIVHKVFVCEEDLVEDIQKFMTENVPKSQFLIFIATKNSLKSQACRYELYLARKFNVKIVPIKGFDIQWADLQHIDTSEFDQKEVDLSNPEERFEFNDGCKNFKEICEKLGNYVKTHKSELKKSKKEVEELEKTKKFFVEITDSKEFRDKIGKNIDLFKKVFQEVSKNQITPSEYGLKVAKALKERGN